ncbi:MAG: DUF308 domain-containing protein [Bacilli bacterium]|nr:DUF308 domain-containing protein [Bacilli bacterium]
MEFIKELKTTLLIMAGFYIIIGLIMLITPTFINNAICYLIGALCLIMGGLSIYTYIGSEVYGPLSIAILIIAIAFIVAGIFIITSPEMFQTIVPIIMGVLLILSSFAKMQSASTIKKYNYNKWWAVLVGALIVFVFGIILLLNPFESLMLFTRILGLFLIVDGISSLITSFGYIKIEKSIK